MSTETSETAQSYFYTYNVKGWDITNVYMLVPIIFFDVESPAVGNTFVCTAEDFYNGEAIVKSGNYYNIFNCYIIDGDSVYACIVEWDGEDTATIVNLIDINHSVIELINEETAATNARIDELDETTQLQAEQIASLEETIDEKTASLEETIDEKTSELQAKIEDIEVKDVEQTEAEIDMSVIGPGKDFSIEAIQVVDGTDLLHAIVTGHTVSTATLIYCVTIYDYSYQTTRSGFYTLAQFNGAIKEILDSVDGYVRIRIW